MEKHIEKHAECMGKCLDEYRYKISGILSEVSQGKGKLRKLH